VLVIILINSQ